MKKLSVLMFAILSLLNVQAQRTCGTDEIHNQKMQDDPQYAAKRLEIDRYTQEYVNSGAQRSSSQRSVITIPVVVHVIYNNSSNPAGNISDAQIYSQIARLNTDYNKMNADTANIPAVWKSLAANVGIYWCLAVRDPNGLPTTGIIRKSTTVTSWSTNDAVKYSAQGGDDAWPADSYLNFWVCDLGQSLLGYSQFPGGAAATDGCVILNSAFGDAVGSVTTPYNLGRTVTHEVGHWLNLYHPFQGGCNGGDSCADTPPTAAATYNCNTFPLLGTGCSTTSPGIMFMDYMDYSDDACLYMFTNNQNSRIQANFVSPHGYRTGILNSLGCVPPGGGPYALFSAVPTTICAGQSVTFTNTSLDTPRFYYWSFPGGVPDTFVGMTPPPVTYNTPGSYTVSLTVVRDTFTNTKTMTNYITVVGSQHLPLTEGFQASFPPTGWSIGNPDNATAWTQSTTAGGYATSSSSAVFLNSTRTGVGQRDYLYTPILNFSNGVDASTKLKFDYAYARRISTRTGSSKDTFSVIVSTDCGATWTTIWSKPDTFLATAPNFSAGIFAPTGTQWATDSTITLGAYAGQPSVQFGFVNYNGRGNAMYLDNVNITNTLPLNYGIADMEPMMHISVVPNPATDKCTINLEMDRQQSTTIDMYDMIGQKVWSKDLGTIHAASETISMDALTAGVYIVKVKAGERSYSQRIVKQ
jgi:PKD repeat protein